ncbi:hypothetical protein CLIB1423_06S03246 [[Candida] railenensis]|uniref:Uncharacterized protein n=1 Tax=[Candida] railenensis TaxID=45579 RepID=A0A9P0VXB1_9ASCO|nr:hypothetical protein CLIB1423_06S03246 [[Candida] railenensis]
MPNKYTPLDSADDSNSIPETVLPSYELDEILPGVANGNNHVYGPPQPLHVKFHGDDKKVLKFELNYYPHLGVDGIHQIIRKKLRSMDIDLGDDLYSIGVRRGLKFRFISIDEDSVGKSIHYIRAGEESATERALKRKDILFIVMIPLAIIAVLIIFMGSLILLAIRYGK